MASSPVHPPNPIQCPPHQSIPSPCTMPAMEWQWHHLSLQTAVKPPWTRYPKASKKFLFLGALGEALDPDRYQSWFRKSWYSSPCLWSGSPNFVSRFTSYSGGQTVISRITSFLIFYLRYSAQLHNMLLRTSIGHMTPNIMTIRLVS